MYIKNFGEFFINQIEYAGTILLSRTDKVTGEKLRECVEMIRQHNAKAAIITTPLDQLEGAAVLETIEGADTLEGMMNEMLQHAHDHHHEGECCEHEHHHHEGECCEHGHHHHEGECCEHEHHHHHEGECCEHEHHHHHHHHADEVFTSWGMETPALYTKEKIEKILTALDSGEYGAVLRAKGMVPAEDGTWIYYDYVPEEHDIRSGKPEVTGKICVIGSQLKEEKLTELFC